MTCVWRMVLGLGLLAGCDRVFGLVALPDAPNINAGLVAYYPMDELGSSATSCAPDASHDGHDGSCLPGIPPLVSGQIGMAFGLDGATRIQIPTSGALAQPTAMTFAGWVLFSDVPAVGACPFNRLLGNTNSNSWQICAYPDQLVYYYFDGVSPREPASAPISTSVWHHVALTWDGAQVISYIDAGRFDASAFVLAFDDSPIVLGADLDSGVVTNPVTGAIDDVRFYDRVLTDGEILELATMH
jgi:hypothetical protein